jgi:hypothetical protein
VIIVARGGSRTMETFHAMHKAFQFLASNTNASDAPSYGARLGPR